MTFTLNKSDNGKSIYAVANNGKNSLTSKAYKLFVLCKQAILVHFYKTYFYKVLSTDVQTFEIRVHAIYVYTDPPALEIKHSSIGLSIGSKFNIFCVATDGNPLFNSPSYSYSICVRRALPAYRTNILEGCFSECCLLGAERLIRKTIDFHDRGHYWCQVSHDSKEQLMLRNSSELSIDVQCMFDDTMYACTV